MKALTLRNIPPEVGTLIEQKAAETGLSLGRTVIRLLQEQLEIDRGGQRVFHDLDHLAGCWDEREAAEFEQQLAEARRIDPELWT